MTFRDKVYKVTKKIPKGKVATYGQIARLAGKPGASRAVGYYMKINPDAPQVPCHRVVGSNGKLVGYSGRGGIYAKKKILIGEGVSFKKDKIDLFRFQWQAP